MLIELRLEDGFDALALGRADGKRPSAGGLQTRRAVVLDQIQQSQASAIALLGMRTVLELPLDHIACGGSDRECPVQEPSRGPLHVFAMRLWHVLGQRAEAPRLAER